MNDIPTKQKDTTPLNHFSGSKEQSYANKALFGKFEIKRSNTKRQANNCSNCDTKYPLLDVISEIIIGILFFLDI